MAITNTCEGAAATSLGDREAFRFSYLRIVKLLVPGARKIRWPNQMLGFTSQYRSRKPQCGPEPALQTGTPEKSSWEKCKAAECSSRPMSPKPVCGAHDAEDTRIIPARFSLRSSTTCHRSMGRQSCEWRCRRRHSFHFWRNIRLDCKGRSSRCLSSAIPMNDPHVDLMQLFFAAR